MEDYLKKHTIFQNYQREYSWGEDELADFLEDLSSVKKMEMKRSIFGQL